jgi:hypothetical protein
MQTQFIAVGKLGPPGVGFLYGFGMVDSQAFDFYAVFASARILLLWSN